MRQKLIDLEKNLYEERDIKPVRRGDLAGEYGDRIMDFSKKPSITNTLLKPYLNTETHGVGNYDALFELLKRESSKTVLDLGCGAGELLAKYKNIVPNADCYGSTIHLGEVKYARDRYGLKHVYPIDMREISQYFEPDFFDAIVVFGAFQYIHENERRDVVHQCYHILKNGGLLIVVDYYNHESSKVPEMKELESMFTIEQDFKACQGTGRVYRKHHRDV